MALSKPCCLPHHGPGVGIHFLSPSPSPRTLPELLGIPDLELQEQMAKGHPYAFNMGHGKMIPFKDYNEAGEVLMERNMPEVLHNIQTKAVFLPETHLPKMPRVVDLEEFEEKKKSFTSEALAFLGMKRGREDITNTIGDISENELSDALKNFYDRASDTKVLVLQGCALRAPRKGRGGIQENDIVIVDFQRKTILTGSAGHKTVKQAMELKSLLEKYFTSALSSGDWCFVGMVFANTIKQPLCLACSPFVIRRSTDLPDKLASLEKELKHLRVKCSPSHAEYVSLVQGLAFVLLSHPISTHCTIASEVYDKVVGKPATDKAKAKAGQGDFQSIVFWTNQQAKIML